jgi:hypothetical protein
MNTTTDRRTSRLVTTRRLATLSVAGVLAGLALAPTAALADHPTAGGDGGGSTTTSSGDRWSYLYDVAQRKEAMARVQESNANQASTTVHQAAPSQGNPWSYMYRVDPPKKQVVPHRIPPMKSRHVAFVERKAHPALARIAVSVAPSTPATCYVPDSVDPETRRLIAVQLCDKAHVVPAVFLERAAVYEPAYSLGHL